MNNRENWILLAAECEAFEATANAQENRDMLLAAATRWHRMTKVARDLDVPCNRGQTRYRPRVNALCG